MSTAKLELDPADVYVPPSPLAEAVQYPMDDRWANRVLNGYRRSGRWHDAWVRMEVASAIALGASNGK